MKSKISLLIPNLAGGGAERVMVILANEFSKKNYQVDLVIVNTDDMHYFSELSDHVNLVNLNKKRAMSAVLSIRKYLRKAKPDVLLTTLNHVSAAAGIALFLAGKLPTKFFPREDRAPQRHNLNTPYMFCLSYIVKWAYRKADGIISLSNDMADQLKQQYKLITPIHTIYNPIYFDKLLSKAEEEIVPPLPWTQHSYFVLGVGRLTTQKDFATLIRAVALVRDSHNIKLVILGDGPERDSLMALATELGIHDSFHMPGFVENPFSYMKSADVFVLSSVLEGLPNALIQSMVCGTQCIATNCPTGPREILRNGSFGPLVEVGDHKAIAKEIINHLNSRINKTPSLQLLEAEYDAKKIAESYIHAFDLHNE